jgi:hypothetical protein
MNIELSVHNNTHTLLAKSTNYLILSLITLFTPHHALSAPPDWQHLQAETLTGIEDRSSLFNDFFNDEAPQYHPKGWMIPNSRLMAIAQGSHLLSDKANQSVAEWQDRHQHSHEQWTDVVLEGKPSGKWRYFLNLNVAEPETIVDEAYLNTSLGAGWQMKAGQFFSAFGRLNSQHVHDRDFVDAPLIYQRLFGAGSALQEKGIQLSYALTPTWFWGGEVLSATNRDQFYQDHLSPTLYNLFSRWGQAWNNRLYSLVGISWAKGSINISNQQADSDWQAIDFTLKQWLSGEQYWMLQGEWLNRQTPDNASINQQGYYLMGLYRFTEAWRIGIRHEMSNASTQVPDSQKESLVVEYDPTSWSRIRLQLGHEQQEQGIEGNYLLLGWQAGVHWLE